jgi:hypothetical protein
MECDRLLHPTSQADNADQADRKQNQRCRLGNGKLEAVQKSGALSR